MIRRPRAPGKRTPGGRRAGGADRCRRRRILLTLSLVKMHGSLYAREHGFSMDFEAYVAGTLAGYAWPLGPRQRLWLIERGRGLGNLLVEEAVRFSRSSGYSSVVLWTVSSLATATALYRRAGFTLSERTTHDLWGAERTEERCDLSFSGAG